MSVASGLRQCWQASFAPPATSLSASCDGDHRAGRLKRGFGKGARSRSLGLLAFFRVLKGGGMPVSLGLISYSQGIHWSTSLGLSSYRCPGLRSTPGQFPNVSKIRLVSLARHPLDNGNVSTVEKNEEVHFRSSAERSPVFPVFPQRLPGPTLTVGVRKRCLTTGMAWPGWLGPCQVEAPRCQN